MQAQSFTATIASAAATSDSIDVGYGAYRTAYINNKAGAEIKIQGSNDDSAFADLYVLKDAGAAVTFAAAVLGSAMSGTWRELPLGQRFIRAVATGTVANGGTVDFTIVFANY